jgi:hypothetical protein
MMSLRTRSGRSRATFCAIMEPMEKPRTSTWMRPRASMKRPALFAISAKVVGTSPLELAMPALLKRITSRPCAKPSVTEGSQLSILPRMWGMNTSGMPSFLPKRRYAKRMPLASTNWVGAV